MDNKKPRILAKPQRISNLEKRKKPLSYWEMIEVTRFHEERAERNLERAQWDANQQLLKEEQAQQVAEERQARFLRSAHYVYHMIHGIVPLIPDMPPEDKSVVGRLIGVKIREITPYIQLDWQSEAFLNAVEEAAQAGDPKPKATKEHIYPMQFSGEFVVSHIQEMGDISFDQFFDYAKIFNQVADVLKHENFRLGNGRDAPQKANVYLHPELAYQVADVRVNFTPISRLEHVAPPEVLARHFGDRLEEFHKYNC